MLFGHGRRFPHKILHRLDVLSDNLDSESITKYDYPVLTASDNKKLSMEVPPTIGVWSSNQRWILIENRLVSKATYAGGQPLQEGKGIMVVQYVGDDRCTIVPFRTNEFDQYVTLENGQLGAQNIIISSKHRFALRAGWHPNTIHVTPKGTYNPQFPGFLWQNLL